MGQIKTVIDKSAIRKEIIKVRDGISTEYREKAAVIIAEKFLSLWSDYGSYALYCAVKSELSVYPLMQALWRAKKTVLLPKVMNGDLRLYRCDSTSGLKRGYMGIYEPVDSLTLEQIDIVAVPGVAFDRRGYRLGYGKGFYDRMLAGISAKITVGIAFNAQIVDFAPHEEHDIVMDAVLTEKEIVAGSGII